jgi:hypothetical protein
MRRYDIGSGILLILSIIHFALAAPLSVQEKRQKRVDVVNIPKDVITVLGRRWEEDLEKLGEEYLKTGGKPVESSDSTLSSSSAPSGSDHGSTNVVQPPAPNPALTTTNPDLLTEPSSCSSSKWARGNCLGVSWSNLWSAIGDDGVRGDVRPASPEESDQAHQHQVDPGNPPSTSGYTPSLPEPKHESEVLTNPPPPPSSKLDYESTNVVQAPAPNPASSKANPDQTWDFIPSYKGGHVLNWPQYTSSSSGYDSDLEFMRAHAPPPPNHPLPSIDSDLSTNPDLDWNHLTNLEDSPLPRPASPKEFDQAHKYQADDVNRPSTSGHAPSPPEPEHEAGTPPLPNLGSPKEPEDEVDPGPLPNPDPEPALNHQSSNADSQPVDP